MGKTILSCYLLEGSRNTEISFTFSPSLRPWEPISEKITPGKTHWLGEGKWGPIIWTPSSVIPRARAMREGLQLSAGDTWRQILSSRWDHPWAPRGTYPLFFVENKMIWYYIVQRRESGRAVECEEISSFEIEWVRNLVKYCKRKPPFSFWWWWHMGGTVQCRLLWGSGCHYKYEGLWSNLGSPHLLWSSTGAFFFCKSFPCLSTGSFFVSISCFFGVNGGY